jgi:very-short-patch-repair endonuclease
MRPAPIGDAKLLVHQMVLPHSDVTVLDGIRVTTVVRTLSDLMLSASRYEAVAALDHALNRGMLDREDLSTMERIMAGRRGVVHAREWVKQADSRAESVLETRVRLRCLDGGVPPNDLQVEIGVYRVDMLWSRGRLIGEADGRSIHDTPGALFHDRERQNALTAAGFAVVRFTWEDTLNPDRVPMIVRRAFQGRQIDHRGYGHDTPSSMTVTS